MSAESLLRIGALSQRVGVSPELLRAWERRYGLLQPTRSHGGFRLYSSDDEERVRLMRRYLDAGVSAAEAARMALALAAHEPAGDARSGLAHLSVELGAALDRLDESGAQANFDRLLASFTLETVLRDVVLPYLHASGERWKRGEATVAQEHFASNLLRGRLLGLARGWGRGTGCHRCLGDQVHAGLVGPCPTGSPLRLRAVCLCCNRPGFQGAPSSGSR